MKARLAFIAGVGIGYVLGARAGRGQYEKIKTQAANVWNDPKVQNGIKTAEETIKEQAPVVAEKAKEAAAAGAEKAKEAAAAGTEKAKEKAEEVKDARAEAKAEKEAEKADKKAQKLADEAPADVVSDPATDMNDEGPATTK
ncbi:hypothetical protein ACFP6B_10660 [Rothia nasimurium]|uniref:hypothetical protein n=1 Tax=Rothia nasimurium TaxID=85336 RepID=UPI003624026A